MLVDTKKVLEELLAEIIATDPELFPPRNEKEKGEKSLGVLDDPLIKQLYCLATFYRREGRKIQVDMEELGPTSELQAELQKYKHKYEFLVDLKWYLLRTKFDCWTTGIGIREGWEVIAVPPEDDSDLKALKIRRDELPKFLRDLLE